MPLPLSRLFPKIKTVSNNASLILSVNAIANFHGHIAVLPARRAPKQLPIILEGSFKFVLHTNDSNISVSILADHLKRVLDSSASLLGISSTQVVQDNVVLATSNRSESSSQTSFLPYAILDHIVLDYRFKASKLTEPHHDSQSQDLLLPLRELLDYVLQRLVSIHLIGQLPLVFGRWNDVLENETFMGNRVGKTIGNIFSRSRNDVFRRHIRKSTCAMNKVLTELRKQLIEQLTDDNDISWREQAPLWNSENTISHSLIMTLQAHSRPKTIRRNMPTHSTEETDLLDNFGDDLAAFHDLPKHKTRLLLESDPIGMNILTQDTFCDDISPSFSNYDEIHRIGAQFLSLDDEYLGQPELVFYSDPLEFMEDELPWANAEGSVPESAQDDKLGKQSTLQGQDSEARTGGPEWLDNTNHILISLDSPSEGLDEPLLLFSPPLTRDRPSEEEDLCWPKEGDDDALGPVVDDEILIHEDVEWNSYQAAPCVYRHVMV